MVLVPSSSPISDVVAVSVCPTTGEPFMPGAPVAGAFAASVPRVTVEEAITAKLVSDSSLPPSSVKLTRTFNALPSSSAVTV